MTTKKLTIFQEYKVKPVIEAERATILVDIPSEKLKRVLELLSHSGEVKVQASGAPDCDGHEILNVYLR